MKTCAPRFEGCSGGPVPVPAGSERGALRAAPQAGLRLRSQAGFTLIELLAVMVIIGLLATFLLTTLGGSDDQVRTELTKARLAQLATLLESYEGRHGDYPPSRFDPSQGALPNQLNLGGEALVVALWSRGFEGGGALETDDLINSDGDRAIRSLTDFPDAQLFELRDGWDNPIAYLRADDYGSEQIYLTTGSDGQQFESRVRAVVDSATQRYARAGTFQLHSAGADGEFGTEDDVFSFNRQ
jgi:prepilin-type N-terminal cleavage/methylation domain-containing protein